MACENVITLQEIEDAKTNVTVLNEVVVGTTTMTVNTDTNGNPHKTLAGYEILLQESVDEVETSKNNALVAISEDISEVQEIVDTAQASVDIDTATATNAANSATLSATNAQNSVTNASVSAATATNAATSASNSATQSATSASESASAAISTGVALAQANAILGLGIGTSFVNSDGDLIMTYDEGTVTVPPYINSNGEFIVEY